MTSDGLNQDCTADPMTVRTIPAENPPKRFPQDCRPDSSWCCGVKGKVMSVPFEACVGHIPSDAAVFLPIQVFQPTRQAEAHSPRFFSLYFLSCCFAEKNKRQAGRSDGGRRQIVVVTSVYRFRSPGCTTQNGHRTPTLSRAFFCTRSFKRRRDTVLSAAV